VNLFVAMKGLDQCLELKLHMCKLYSFRAPKEHQTSPTDPGFHLMWPFSRQFVSGVHHRYGVFCCLNEVLVSLGMGLYFTSSGTCLSTELNVALFRMSITVTDSRIRPCSEESSELKEGCC